MSFLNPLFLLGGLAALFPLLLHLVRRERAQKFEFPTLMFLRRVSRKSIRYQKLRHLLLLALRVLTLLFLALAFTRPFWETPSAAGPMERASEAHILLLDNSMSMDYGDRWNRARSAALEVAGRVRPGDKVALIEFSDHTVTRVPLTTDIAAVQKVLNDIHPGDRPTRYGQALRVAEQTAFDAGTPVRIIHLISDFQKSGWTADEQDFRLGSTIRLRPVDVGDRDYSNLALGDVQLVEDDESGTAGLKIRFSAVNFGDKDRPGVGLTLHLDDRKAAQQSVDIARGGVEPKEFRVEKLSPGTHRLTVEIDDNRLARDNRFSLVVFERGGTPVDLVENPRSGRSGRPPGYFLSRALGARGVSPFRLSVRTPEEVELLQDHGADAIVWNSAPGGSAALQERLRKFVSQGNGLAIVIANEARAADFNRSFATWIPLRTVPSKSSGRRGPGDDYALLTDIRLDHPVFNPFSAPHSGNFSSAMFFYHAVLQPGPGTQVIARFDNGDPAVVAVEVGSGRVVVMSFAADDSSNDLPLKAVYAPFWHQVLRFLQKYRQERHYLEVGESMEPRALLAEAARREQKTVPAADQALVVIDPEGLRLPSVGGADPLTVEKAGFYALRAAGVSTQMAVNTIPAESDLAPGDPEEMVAGWMSGNPDASDPAPATEAPTPVDREKRQALWRFLLFTALALSAAEGWLSHKSVSETRSVRQQT